MKDQNGQQMGTSALSIPFFINKLEIAKDKLKVNKAAGSDDMTDLVKVGSSA